jgi:hypothetical protein
MVVAFAHGSMNSRLRVENCWRAFCQGYRHDSRIVLFDRRSAFTSSLLCTYMFFGALAFGSGVSTDLLGNPANRQWLAFGWSNTS